MHIRHDRLESRFGCVAFSHPHHVESWLEVAALATKGFANESLDAVAFDGAADLPRNGDAEARVLQRPAGLA